MDNGSAISDYIVGSLLVPNSVCVDIRSGHGGRGNREGHKDSLAHSHTIGRIEQFLMPSYVCECVCVSLLNAGTLLVT